jgi:hypothetical protein
MTESTQAPESPASITQTSVVAFFAADHITVTPDAKMYVNGGFFGLLRFPAFPANLATLGVAAVLELSFHDTMKDHTIRIGLRGPDNQDLPVQVEARFRAAPGLETQFGDPGLVPFGLTLTNVQIPTPGAYSLVLWFDGIEKKTYRIRAVQTPMAASSGAPISIPEI